MPVESPKADAVDTGGLGRRVAVAASEAFPQIRYAGMTVRFAPFAPFISRSTEIRFADGAVAWFEGDKLHFRSSKPHVMEWSGVPGNGE